LWKAAGTIHTGFALSLTGKAPEAVQMISSGVKAWQSTGATVWMPSFLSDLAEANAELNHFDDAWRSIMEAMAIAASSKESWYDPELHRIAGDIALRSPQQDAAKLKHISSGRSL
jgi:hypothetical protein